MKKKLILVGAGGHAKAVIDAVDRKEYEIIGILDKDLSHIHEQINGIPIIGADRDAEHYLSEGACHAFIAIGHMGDARIRNCLFSKFKALGYRMINVIHPAAVISESSRLGEGNLIMPNCVVNAEARIGNNTIINTGAIVEHEAIIENDVHLAPGSIVTGMSIVGSGSFIGAGSVVLQNLHIGTNVTIGAGSTVTCDISDNVVAVGSPAREIRRK